MARAAIDVAAAAIANRLAEPISDLEHAAEGVSAFADGDGEGNRRPTREPAQHDDNVRRADVHRKPADRPRSGGGRVLAADEPTRRGGGSAIIEAP